jgi:hypothetical protein
MSQTCQQQTCHTSIMLIHHDEVAVAKAQPSLWGDYAAGKVPAPTRCPLSVQERKTSALSEYFRF